MRRVIFETIIGSHIWGMNHEGSDIDIFRCYQADNDNLLSKMTLSKSCHILFIMRNLSGNWKTFGRGFKSYLGLISPIFIEKLFTLNLDLAEKKTDYNNLMPIDIKETEVKKKKTLEEVIQIEV